MSPSPIEVPPPDRSLSAAQAIVFAGGNGNRMVSLSEQMPKSLLPVANVPIYWFALNLLSRHKVKDVLLVTNAACDAQIRKALKSGTLPPLPNLNIEVVCPGTDSAAAIDDDDEDVDQYGTADILRLLQPRIKPDTRDLLIVSGDIVTDLSLAGMFQLHCANASLVTCLFWDAPLNGPIPGPKTHAKKYRDFSALIPDSGQLVYLCEEEDFDEDEEFDSRLFQMFPKVQFTAQYKDSYIYLLNPAVVELLAKDHERQFSSIKADLIPYLLKGQYLRIGRKVLDVLPKSSTPPSAPTAAANGEEEDELARQPTAPYRCYAYRATTADGSLLAQCNTTVTYFAANKEIVNNATLNGPLADRQRAGAYFRAQKATVSESVVSIDALLDDKATLKKSVVGSNSIIDAKAKIENSVLMDGVVVKSGGVVKSSIIFPNVEVGEGAQVNMCVVGPEQKIANKEKVANTIVRVETEMDLQSAE